MIGRDSPVTIHVCRSTGTMRDSGNASHWTRHFVYRAERTTTTWKFRVGLVVVVFGLVWLTRGWWTVVVARSLVCEANRAPSDAILVENFDPSYGLFERAARLRRAGVAKRVLVPVPADSEVSNPNPIAAGTADLLARLARVGDIEIVAVRETEPISLTAALDVQRFVKRERIRSVLVVSPFFRSGRSNLVYERTLGRNGITVHCDPVEETRGISTWTRSWHGIQDVTEQWVKLQYYRVYVLPFRAPERQHFFELPWQLGFCLI